MPGLKSYCLYAPLFEFHRLKRLSKQRADTKTGNPRAWTLESRQLAIVKVYLQSQLKGGQDEDHAQSLPETYTKTAKTVAEKQVALAGDRLAGEIAKCLARDSVRERA